MRVVDLKAFYRGTAVDLAPDPELYRAVAEELPDVVIEDAWLELRDALAGAEDRLSFDAPIHSLADLDGLPLEPRWLNIKPSRFGTVRELLETIEACEERGIQMYGGGQYELGPGRPQIQRLASVFYPDGPNDVAPSAYNEGEPREGLPQSPLPPREEPGSEPLRRRPRRFGDDFGATCGEGRRTSWRPARARTTGRWARRSAGRGRRRGDAAGTGGRAGARPGDLAGFQRGEAGAHGCATRPRSPRASCSSRRSPIRRSRSTRTTAGPADAGGGKADVETIRGWVEPK